MTRRNDTVLLPSHDPDAPRRLTEKRSCHDEACNAQDCASFVLRSDRFACGTGQPCGRPRPVYPQWTLTPRPFATLPRRAATPIRLSSNISTARKRWRFACSAMLPVDGRGIPGSRRSNADARTRILAAGENCALRLMDEDIEAVLCVQEKKSPPLLARSQAGHTRPEPAGVHAAAHCPRRRGPFGVASGVGQSARLGDFGISRTDRA